MSFLEKYKYNPFTNRLDRIGAAASELARLEIIENYELLVELSSDIGQNTSGTVPVPAGATVEQNAYPNAVAGFQDEAGLVAFNDLDGKAGSEPAKSVQGAFIFVFSLDTNGSYQLTGTPASGSSIYYVVRLKLKDWQKLDGYTIASYRTLAVTVRDTNAYKVLGSTDQTG
jgi:hypothetical protein